MKTFIELVSFEYKKIFMRTASKVALVVLCIGVFLIIINPTRESTVPNVNLFDSKIASATLDDTLLQTTLNKYKELANIPNAMLTTPYGKEIDAKAFEKTLMPYEGIYHLINIVYTKNLGTIIESNSTPCIMNIDNVLPIESLASITEKDFYEQYSKQYDEMYSFWENINKPVSYSFPQKLTFGYAAGYTSFINSFDGQGMIISLLFLTLGICCSPIFAAEHQQNAYAVIITTKHGRCKATWAKVFVGFSFSIILSVIYFGLILLSRLIFFGFEGANVSVQFYDAFAPYNITLGNVCTAIFFTGCVCSIMITAICLLLSSWSKSAFGCIIGLFAIIAAPPIIFIFGNAAFINAILKYFPTMMPIYTHLFSMFKIELFGIEILPIIMFLCICIVVSVASAIAAKKLFVKQFN